MRPTGASLSRILAVVMGLIVLTGCGGGSSSSTSSGSPAVTLSTSNLTFSSQSVGTSSASQAVTVTNSGSATLTFSSSITVSGDFSQSNTCGASLGAGNTCTVSVTFTPTAGGTRTGTLTITDNASGSPHTVNLTGTGLVANTITVSVNAGPANNAVNAAYVSVTVCQPGSTTNCVTIPDVQVDTGSSGLRILYSYQGVSSLNLTQVTGNGTPVYECHQFGANYLWGQVEQADVSMAGETAAGLPIQVIASGNAPSSTSCASGGGNNLGTSTALQANGILGIGTAPQDCGSACAQTSGVPPIYWLCPSSGCTTAQVQTAVQVSNPVVFFNSDNNGVMLTMNSLGSPGSTSGAPSATGTLTFGIGTQTDNALSSSATVYALSLNGQGGDSIYATYNNVTYPAYLDSAEIYTFFLDSTTVAAATAGAGVSSCSTPSVLYCTSSAVSLPFTAKDNASDSATVTLSIGNGTTLWNSSVRGSGSNTAFSNLAGGIALGANDYVELGMPFFYGRTVYVGIAGKVPPSGVPASDAALGYWAF